MPDFPYTQERALSQWSNFHGTIEDVPVPLYCTPDAPTEIGLDLPSALQRHGEALRAIVDYCVSANPPRPLRVMGSRWSLSNIIRPMEVVIDPVNLNRTLVAPINCLTPAYRNGRYAKGYRPFFAQAGAEIGLINSRLAQIRLALQTSGASDGHRIGGCIATGTHGAAIDIGAVHDTILGLHVIVNGDHSVFLHRATNPCFTSDLAAQLAQVTGIPTEDRAEDDLFHAAQVSLGSLGVVHAVALEAAPLYKLRRVLTVRDTRDQELWDALTSLNTGPLHPDTAERPYHVEVVINPYKWNRRDNAFVSLMWKVPAAEDEFHLTSRVAEPEVPSEALTFIGHLSDVFDGPILNHLFRSKLAIQIKRRYRPGRYEPRFPGEMFGPTSLPSRQGTSTELVIDARDAQRAHDAIRQVLRDHAEEGELLLGVLALRFTRSTDALLGLNAKQPSCFLELPSIRNDEVHKIYRHIWEEFDRQSIDFTCHWGQIGGFDRARIDRYFGADRVNRWLAARDAILTTPNERDAFASPVLAEAGLV